MFKLSISTSYTNPEERMDPWREALTCYNDLADEVVRSGENWPYEFSWDYIGKVFNESYEKATGDWVIRMDLDYFFHENDFEKIRSRLEENFDKLWDTWRGGNPRADHSQLNFTKVSLYRYDGLNAERTSEYTLIRFAQSEEKISVKV